MADYSTPEALKTALLNAIANRDLAVLSYRTPDGRQVNFRTIAEMREGLALCDELTVEAAATPGVATRRTSAKFVSGGGW